MTLTPVQLELLTCLQTAAAGVSKRRVVYHTEYFGFLAPTHWVETVDVRDVLPTPAQFEFSDRDLQALEAAGFLRRVEAWTSPIDDLDTKTTYEVVLDTGAGAVIT